MEPITTAPLGLRELKKQETRQQISDQATRLFIAQGFEETTIAEIAAAARVAKKTVTNYFARKEDLALDHQDAFTASLADAVRGRSAGESPYEALRRAFTTAVETQDAVAGFAGPEFIRMIAASPTLVACLRTLHDQREQALAEALAEAAGTEPDDITVRTTAGLFGAVHRILFQRIQELTLAGLPAPQIATTVGAEAETAFTLLAPSLTNYAKPRVG
ncbi:TetR/AcrR family transcriptional regulator [Kribbella sp. WER1]